MYKFTIQTTHFETVQLQKWLQKSLQTATNNSKKCATNWFEIS